jgi:hypothetical protein
MMWHRFCSNGLLVWNCKWHIVAHHKLSTFLLR